MEKVTGEIRCPQCMSSSVQRVEVAHMQDLGKQDLLDGSPSPPQPANYKAAAWLVCAPVVGFTVIAILNVFLEIWMIGTGTLLGVMLLVAGTLIPIGAYFFYKDTRYDLHIYPRLLEAWKKNWICQSCGDIFVPETH